LTTSAICFWSGVYPLVSTSRAAATRPLFVIRDQLGAMDAELDDVVQATAGRGDVHEDPPYFVFALSIPAPARDLLGG
jgi:hypothetical protein